MLQIKFELASEIFKFESVDNRWRTDDGPLEYYKLTLQAFGSGELKTCRRNAPAGLQN